MWLCYSANFCNHMWGRKAYRADPPGSAYAMCLQELRLLKPGEAPPAYIHGADGLGNLTERMAVAEQLDPRSSAQFIVDMARANPGEITLVAVGPLGNLSLALLLEPALPSLLKQVILMGGTVLEPGNVSPVAEANIWNDPHAADQVFTAGWPLTTSRPIRGGRSLAAGTRSTRGSLATRCALAGRSPRSALTACPARGTLSRSTGGALLLSSFRLTMS